MSCLRNEFAECSVIPSVLSTSGCVLAAVHVDDVQEYGEGRIAETRRLQEVKNANS